MNTILVLIDSLNRHYLSAYDPGAIATPNLDRFAKRAWRFDNHFVGSLPCMPARREIFSGFKELMWRPWGPLEPFDARLPRLLEAAGCATGIATDHYHYWEEAANGYLQTFQSAETIRGHEHDFWKPPVPDGEPLPAWVRNIEVWRPGAGRRYYGNVRDFRREEDFFPARVMNAAARWLRECAHDRRFYLQVESFDVHEPFHVPEPYASLYGNGGDRARFTIWPPYQDPDRLTRFMTETTPDELAFIRSQYAGKLAMVDRWFGELLKTFDALQLWDNTMIIVTTDHGHDLGENRRYGKQFPHRDSHANIPLFIWHPDHPGDGHGITRLTSTVDLFATILDAMAVPVARSAHSKSLLPLINGGAADGREAVLYGTFGQGVCCTDGEWTLIKSPATQGPLYFYSSLILQSLDAEEIVQSPVDQGHFIPGVGYPQWKIPINLRVLSRENYLFHRSEDPGQTRNLWDSAPGQRQRLLDILHELLENEGTPPEQYARLGLVR